MASSMLILRLSSILLILGAALQIDESRPKNVLFMVVDDLRPQMNAAYGQKYMITPNLDKLATSGVVFDRAYAQLAWCSPSRSSFMTGRYPDTLQIWQPGYSFRDTPQNPPTGGGVPDLTTTSLPEYFKKHGYLTLGGGKIYHWNFPVNNDIPYSWSNDIAYFELTNEHAPFHRELCPADDKWATENPGCAGCPQNLGDEEFFDYRLANHTVHALRFAKANKKPFFIAAGFIRPHTPWYINQRFVDMYDDVEVKPPKYSGWPKNQPELAFICGKDGVGSDFNITGPRSEKNATLCRKTYYAAVTATDAYVGLVLDELKALDLESSTAVVIFGDHGWHLGEGNQWAKYTNLEFGTRTPLILRAPWLLKPGRTQIFAELVDLYPTLTELAGLPAPQGTEGKSLVPGLTGENTYLYNSAISQFAHCCGNMSIGPECTPCEPATPEEITYMGYALRTSGWRYIAWYKWDGKNYRPQCDGSLGKELYPHDGDAGDDFDSAFETENVVGHSKHVGAVNELHRMLIERFPKAFGHCSADVEVATPVDEASHSSFLRRTRGR